jgi:hypothetical protein
MYSTSQHYKDLAGMVKNDTVLKTRSQEAKQAPKRINFLPITQESTEQPRIDGQERRHDRILHQ